ncbi:hypothetical protein J2T17_007564 [Paenibacillus mucilaginosus]|uniref:hypothetical protein n=1 Tax=Paenibacillus mucilaginosus TaxID=61624 RepID=UPI003D22E0CD
MFRLKVLLILLTVVSVGCGNSVSSFEGQVDKIQDKGFLISCSDAANKGKKGNIDGIGYMCNVRYTEETIFREVNGNLLNVDDISLSSTVNVTLEKPVDIRKKYEKKAPFNLTAKEIVLITMNNDDSTIWER